MDEKELKEFFEMSCSECKFGTKCPCCWSRNCAACITLKKKKESILKG